MRMRVLALASTAALLAASNAHAGQVDITNVGVQSGETTTVTGTINSDSIDESPITTLITLTTTSGNTLPVFSVDLLHDINIGSYSPPLTYITGSVSTDSTGSQRGLPSLRAPSERLSRRQNLLRVAWDLYLTPDPRNAAVAVDEKGRAIDAEIFAAVHALFLPYAVSLDCRPLRVGR